MKMGEGWVAHEFATVEAEQGRDASLDDAEAVVDGLATAVADIRPR